MLLISFEGQSHVADPADVVDPQIWCVTVTSIVMKTNHCVTDYSVGRVHATSTNTCQQIITKAKPINAKSTELRSTFPAGFC